MGLVNYQKTEQDRASAKKKKNRAANKAARTSRKINYKKAKCK
jgi:hypothetical protein